MIAKKPYVLETSAAERWCICPVSAIYAEAVGRDGGGCTRYAAEGTVAHEVHAAACRSGAYRVDSSKTHYGRDKRYPHEILIPPRDLELIQQSVACVAVEASMGAEVHVEVPLDIKFGADGYKGTSDIVCVYDTHLVVADYKHGVGKPVKACGNKQLLGYASGAAAKFGRREYYTLVIAQPRAGHPWDAWEISDAELRDAESEFAAAAARVASAAANPTIDDCVVGTHCHWCKGEMVCPAQSLSQLKIFALGGAPPIQSDPRSIKMWLDAGPGATKGFKAAEGKALELLASGEFIEGYKLIQGAGKSQWRCDLTEEERAPLRAAGVLTTEEVSLGITDARPLCKKAGIDISLLLTKSAGKPQVVHASHTSPAVATAVDMFENLESEES